MQERQAVPWFATVLLIGVLTMGCSHPEERLQKDDVSVFFEVLRHFVGLATGPETAGQVPILRTDIRRLPELTVLFIDPTNVPSNRLLTERSLKDICKTQGINLAAGLSDSIRERNRARVGLYELRSQSAEFRIMLVQSLCDDPLAMEHAHSNAYAFVWLAMPGYDKAGTNALVQFWFGPTVHGAFAVYGLTRSGSSWHIDWHYIDAFL